MSNRVTNHVALLFDRLVDSPSDAVQERFAAAAAGAVRPAQEQAIRLADAYMQTAERIETGAAAYEPLNAVRIAAGLRGGISPLDVYRRPIVSLRTALSEGRAWQQARAEGRNRATSTADTDLQLASMKGQQQSAHRSSRIVGTRRMPDANACAFCLLVSTQRYHKDELQPVHSHCHCSTIPIIGSQDPGQIIDRELLKQVHAEGVTVYKENAKGQRVKYTYKTDDIAIRKHGELGPVITLRDQHFTGPNDLVA